MGDTNHEKLCFLLKASHFGNSFSHFLVKSSYLLYQDSG